MVLQHVSFENQTQAPPGMMHWSTMTEVFHQIRVKECYRQGQPFEWSHAVQRPQARDNYQHAQADRESQVQPAPIARANMLLAEFSPVSGHLGR